MSFINTFQKMFTPGYMIETAPEQAMIDELQMLRYEVSRLTAIVQGMNPPYRMSDMESQELDEFLEATEREFTDDDLET